MALWLKHEADLNGTWTVAQINTIPTGVQAIAIVAGVLATSLCMIYPIWCVMCVVAAVLFFANLCLLIWDIPIGLHCESQPLIHQIIKLRTDLSLSFKVAVYYMLGLTSCVTPILFPWVNMVMKDDNEARAFTTGAMVSIS